MKQPRVLHIANPATTENPSVGPLKTFCGRATRRLTWWATPDLTDRADFHPGRRRCMPCEEVLAACRKAAQC